MFYISTLLFIFVYTIHASFIFSKLTDHQLCIFLPLYIFFFALFFTSFHKASYLSNKSLPLNYGIYCDKCLYYRPKGAHHCSVCNHCVLRYDHHCYFLDNCIGKKNYKFFILTLVYGMLWIKTYAAMCIVLCATHPYKYMTYEYLAPISIAVFFLTLLIPLFAKHVSLIKKGQTTYEEKHEPNVCSLTLPNESLWRRFLPF